MISVKEFILGNGICLHNMGINNYVLNWDDSLILIPILENYNIAVLGGDVYIKENDDFKVAYDNWYLDKSESESQDEYVKKSILKTERYIKNYFNKDAFFAFVLELPSELDYRDNYFVFPPID